MPANRRHTILVLESPWNLYSGDANKSSVLPFVEGLAKQDGDIDVFYANFYDLKSFEAALECLCKFRSDNAVVYIAGHGNEDSIAGVATQDLMFEVGYISKRYNISGLLLGACLAGADTDTLTHWMKETHIKWCAAYSTSVNWLEGTMIDCSILGTMATLPSEHYRSEDPLVDALASSVAAFSRDFPVGRNGRKRTKLSDGMEFVIRPARQGCLPRVVTPQVFEAWKDKQL